MCLGINWPEVALGPMAVVTSGGGVRSQVTVILAVERTFVAANTSYAPKLRPVVATLQAAAYAHPWAPTQNNTRLTLKRDTDHLSQVDQHLFRFRYCKLKRARRA